MTERLIDKQQANELREDLGRDEEIFQRKQAELKRTQAELGSAVEEVASLKQESTGLRGEVLNLQREVASLSTALEEALRANPLPQSSGGIAAPPLSTADIEAHNLTLTMMQRENRAMASMAEDDDLVQVGDDLEDTSKRPPSTAPSVFDPSSVAQDGLSALEEERRRHVEEKQALDEQSAQLARQFHIEQHKASKKLKALEFNIQLKQDLIRNLVKTEQTLQGRNEAAEAKIAELETEIAQMKATDLANHKTPVKDRSGASYRIEDLTPESRRIRDQFSAKLRAREAELEGLRKTQEESRKMMRDYEASEKRIKTLEGEIGKIGQQCEQLKRKAKDDSGKYEELKAEHNAKLREVKGKMEARLRELEGENERQREVLRCGLGLGLWIGVQNQGSGFGGKEGQREVLRCGRGLGILDGVHNPKLSTMIPQSCILQSTSQTLDPGTTNCTLNCLT